MQGVAQKHPMACGLACVSFVTGTPYDELASLQPMAKLSGTGFLCPMLVEILEVRGFRYGWKKLAESEREGELNIGDIVFIEPSPTHKGGHFLVRAEEGYMDPWINLNPENADATTAQSGFREYLPGRAEYLVYKLPPTS